MSDYTLDQLRRIDGLVEQHVFGSRIVVWDFPYGDGPCYEVERTESQDDDGETLAYVGMLHVPPYTTDWAHAGRVLEWLVTWSRYMCIELRKNPQTQAWYSDEEPGGMEEGEGATLQLAICLHALAVAGVDVEREVNAEKGVGE